MAEEIIAERYNPSSWNLYTFHCSDGENWSDDNDKALEKMSTLIKLSQLAGYIQITPGQESMWGQEMAEVFNPLVSDKFKVCKIKEKQDIWPQFAKLFGGKYEL